MLEYPTAVDSNGNPTAWSTLTTLSDTTNGLTTTGAGTITFDPPSNWVPAVVDSTVSGTMRYYYVRFRTTTAFSTIPVASTILGYNYTGAVSVNGTNQVTGTYTIPAFDYAADTDHDGYLDAQEYANRTPGMNAYFAYQGRLFTSYGQMHFVTNPASPAFRNWALAYYPEYLTSNQYATGLFVDNSENNPPEQGSNFSIIEPTDSYTEDYASLLNAIGSAIAPDNGWIMANVDGHAPTAGANGNGQTNADPVIHKVQASYEESDIRALTDDTSFFLGQYAWSYYRETYDSSSYAVLDSQSLDKSSQSEEKGQTQLTTLAAYYLLAPTNPSQGALDFFGGEGTGTPWVQPNTSPPAYNHWSPAATYNVGTPVSALPQTPVALVTNGSDPENSNYKFNVYERSFTGPNGQSILVLYKPVSEYNGQAGTTDPQTATTVTPAGGYSWYVLQADGTLSSTAQTSISLQNGEGAILVQEGTNSPQIAGATMIAAPIPTSPAAATYSTPSTSGASSVSQGSAGPTTADLPAAETFDRLLPGLFLPNAAGDGQVPMGPSADPGTPSALDRFFSLWETTKMSTAFAGSNGSVPFWLGEGRQAQMDTPIPSLDLWSWLGSSSPSKSHGNNSQSDESPGAADEAVADSVVSLLR